MFGSAAIVVAGHRNLFLHRIKISEKKSPVNEKENVDIAVRAIHECEDKANDG